MQKFLLKSNFNYEKVENSDVTKLYIIIDIKK